MLLRFGVDREPGLAGYFVLRDPFRDAFKLAVSVGMLAAGDVFANLPSTDSHVVEPLVNRVFAHGVPFGMHSKAQNLPAEYQIFTGTKPATLGSDVPLQDSPALNNIDRRPLKFALNQYMFTLLAGRYERSSVLLTSNLAFSKWDQIFKDAIGRRQRSTAWFTTV